jgi:hypothetical protein
MESQSDLMLLRKVSTSAAPVSYKVLIRFLQLLALEGTKLVLQQTRTSSTSSARLVARGIVLLQKHWSDFSAS